MILPILLHPGGYTFSRKGVYEVQFTSFLVYVNILLPQCIKQNKNSTEGLRTLWAPQR